ncbi:endo alpha-1,4 polygalactosaminidase [Amycolatopsis sp. cmx-8-4]|uniref:endo alpha-1,4 polygalactosaminidase n=1 Tax=Amycolatopsis sp. cmx-8-4 TaxID=2790947 RepID=UPI00397C39E5
MPPRAAGFDYRIGGPCPPAAEGDLDAGLLLRNGGRLDECAAKGYRAVELDNYDSYSRSEGLLSTADAEEFMRLLSAHAHAAGLAVGQKNASEPASRKKATGVDFAVAEECGEQDNCAEFTEQFGDDVLVIEYTGEGLASACAKWGG